MADPMKHHQALIFGLLLSVGCSTRTLLPESTTTVIGPEGGEARSTDGLFILRFPAGALSKATPITIETDRSLPRTNQLGPLYSIGPVGLRAARPIDAFVRPARTEWIGELAVAARADGELRPEIGTVYDASTKQMHLKMNGFGCDLSCASAADCGLGALCSAGHCQSTCASDFDCRRPPECLVNELACHEIGTSCDGAGACSTGFTVPSIPVPLPPPVTRPTQPGVSCHGTTLGVFAFVREVACAGRFCGESCTVCDVSSPACVNVESATCNADGACVSAPVSCDIPSAPDGWDDAPGSGRAFIVNQVAITGADRGFDLDGQCRGPGDCADNQLWQFGAIGNDQLRQGLLGGEFLIMIEIAGLDEPYTGDDESVTVRFYGARDADDPFFPANNFQIPTGETTCCEFKLNPDSVVGAPVQPRARARIPAKIEHGFIRGLTQTTIDFTLTVGVPPHPDFRLERIRFSARLPTDLTRLEDVLLGGAVPIQTLAAIENPYCKTVTPACPRALPQSSLLDFFATLAQPDIDLDVPPDGLEIVSLGGNGRIAECRDGCSGCAPVPPIELAEPWSCVEDARMRDGYSVAFSLAGVAAKIVGIAQ